MSQIENPKPVLLIAAVTSRNKDAFEWTARETESLWGPVTMKSPVFDFTETSFYTKSMGVDLKKQFFVYEHLFDSAGIAGTKHISNHLEERYAAETDFPEARPVNIDPGYITEAKLVLVTTKDRDHRLYLRDGIYAEVTLFYRNGHWNHSRWTYPDYQRRDFQSFFEECRSYLRDRIKHQRAAR